MRSNDNESSIRWRQICREQLTYSINLILGFSVATLGFQLSLLISDKFLDDSWYKVLFLQSILFVFLAVFVGVLVVLCRLTSFRKTAIIVRDRRKIGQCRIVKSLRDCTDFLDSCTWTLFYLQIAFFGVGILLCTISLVCRFL